jgi:hypothetical protein
MSRRRRRRRQIRERGGAAADDREYRNSDFKSELDGRQEPRHNVLVDVSKSKVDQGAVEVPDSSVPWRHNTFSQSVNAAEISGHSVYELHHNSRS